ncbi:hypothetical protein DW973_11320 [Parabacteroides merdae]|nr:hypothetical protein DW973_11320 [Parabacteroides merdae]
MRQVCNAKILLLKELELPPPEILFSVNSRILESIFKKSREIIEAQNNEIKNQKPPKRDSLPVIIKALTIRSQ